ncbi:MAG: hypothetical protein CEE38_03560 [Planctomycetes bacterium B3_Pla]|nr:MAG: hypothetical protein CEE38_03560 [Planctomycetes bacterium B3_Pla]
MSQQQLLKKVIQTLDLAEIQYMLTGSVVSSLQGEPRATHDIDMIVAIEKSKAHELAEAFPHPDFYLAEHSIIDAISSSDMFNLIDLKSGDKVDFWILSDEAFDRSRFSRRYAEGFMGAEMQVSSPEDTILAKLRWAELCGGSEKHFTDALRVYEVQHGNLDQDYLESWAENLNVQTLWKRIKNEAEIA